MERTGRCLCGAASFVARNVHAEASACHCGMCLRWASGPYFGVPVGSLDWEHDETVATFPSSTWAERGFCTRCGSSLFFRITAPGTYQGMTSVAMGSFDDKTGLTLAREWFIDKRPELYELAGERTTVTEAEAMAMLGDAG
jgi:hypothetical protein